MAEENSSDNSGKLLGIGCAGLGIGCVVVILILVVAVGAGVYYVTSNFKNLVADAGGSVAVGMVEDSKLPQDQKDRIITRINEVKDGYKAGDINEDQLGAIFEALTQSPIFHVAMVEHFDEQYVQPSQLSDEEKADARRTLDRFARGLFEETLTMNDFNTATAPISNVDADGNQSLKENPTVEELREALSLAKAKVDEVGVADEPFDINYADEFDEAVDKALAGETDIQIEGDVDAEPPMVEEPEAEPAMAQ